MNFNRIILLQSLLITTMFFLGGCGESKSEKHPNSLNYSFEGITKFDTTSTKKIQNWLI